MKWKGLKQLNQLFVEGTTSSDLLKFPYAKRLYSMEYFVQEKKTLTKTRHFDSYYLQKHQDQFNNFNDLLSRYGLKETNFDLGELKALLKLSADKENIIDKGLSQKEISTLYFDDAKRLKKSTKLFDAVLKVLELENLAIDEHDQQFLSVLHCKKKIPTAIILCENYNQLRKPRLNEVELWYSGGRNTAKLMYVQEPTIPFYYLCDWDNRGIEIFQDVKRNIFSNIEILIPQKPIKLLDLKSK